MQHSNNFSNPVHTGLRWPRPFDVLIVDDHVDGAELLQMLFEFEGHRVAVAFSAEDALEMAKDKSFDAAYIDLKLNGMSGYTLASKLRKLTSIADIPFVAMSGTDHVTDDEVALLNRFDYFLLKPFGLQQLLVPLRELAASLATRTMEREPK